MKLDPKHEDTQRSWDVATRAHNAHKRDQGAWLREHSTLFPEEVALLGDVRDRALVHLCCNSGQDSISLARTLGARVTGVDFSGEAVATARRLSEEAGVPLALEQAEVVAWLESTPPGRFEVAFASYGCLPWMEDFPRFARGVARVLAPGGRFVCVEFHPMAWSFDAAFALRDPYFAPGHAFSEPVSDYVGKSGGALSPSGHVALDAPYENPHPAHAYQQTVAELVTGLLDAGLALEALREWPWANGCRLHDGLVPLGAEGLDARRFAPPPGVPSLPLMLGLVARRPR